jgi:hypothetical protein
MRYVVIAAGWLWGLAALPVVTDAAVDFGWSLLLSVSGLMIGLVWLAYSTVIPAVFKTPRVRWLWWSVPVIGVGGLLLSMTHRDLAARVWLCESELREYAEAIRQNPQAPRESHRVGLVVVRFASADENQVFLYTAHGFMDSAGIVYRPDGNPPEHAHRHQHLYGPWWWFWEDF